MNKLTSILNWLKPRRTNHGLTDLGKREAWLKNWPTIKWIAGMFK